MRAKQQRRVICGKALITLAMIAVLCCSQEVLAQQWTTNGNDISNTNSGNVGIGTTTPDANAKLHVFKPLGAGVDVQSPNSGGWSRVRLVTGTRTYGWFAGDASNSDAPNKIGLYDYNASAFRMMIDSSGNVGIGTTSPITQLDVQLNSATANKLVGRFGNNSTSGGGALRVYANVTSNATLYPALELSDSSFWIGSLAADRTTGLRFRTGSNISSGEASLTDRMVISPSGSVGIGTASPDSSYRLDVVGNLRVSGNIAAKYQDVAEWVESSQLLPAATVVVLNSNKSNQVVASSRAYDTRVAGVVSAQPGLILGERGDNKILVATTGRVRIKVDATRGAIRVGDLLVTSDREGVAMKSRPINIGGTRIHRPGTLIGKALEPLAKGQGEILVLLSLQ